MHRTEGAPGARFRSRLAAVRLNGIPARLVLIATLVAASSALFLRHLGDPYITLWDEAVHVNVVRNLVVDCCTPQLHRQPAGTQPDDWTNNHIWLHKPPLPFLFNAAVARLLGVDPFGIRAAAYLLAQCLIVMVFWIGVTRFGPVVGLAAAALVAFNHYTFQLVHGHQFSGVPDLALACVLMGVLHLAFVIVESPRPRAYVGFGLLCGLAFLCKDGLGLLPLAVLALLPVAVPWRRHAAGLGLAAVAAAVVLLPPSLYLAYRFPVEALLEQQHRVAHLFRDVEGWKRPVDYYVTIFFPRVTSPLVAGVACLAVGFGIAARRRMPYVGVLSIWIATYLVLLSFSVSKISNFIYPVMPAVYLLLPAVARELWRTGRHLPVLAASASIIVTALLVQRELLGSASWILDSAPWHTRPALIAIQWVIFAAVAASAAGVRAPRARAASSLAGVTVAMALVLVASVRASAAAAVARPLDYERQMALREAVRSARAALQSEDVVLVDWPGVGKGHLYVMYWSGLESYESASLPFLSQLRTDRRVFLLRDPPAASGPEAIRLNLASLRRLR